MAHEEAKVSVLLSDLLSEEEIVETLTNLQADNNLFVYTILLKSEDDNIGAEDTQLDKTIMDYLKDGVLRPTDISNTVLKENYAMLVSDRELSNDKVVAYYLDIMDYHQAIGETLSDDEMIMRDNEVKEKWLNGKFNYWLLRSEDEV